MTTELTLLAWTLVLAFIQILLPASLRVQETGVAYNAGARDKEPPVPPGVMSARILRAQKNLFETLPLFIGAVLIVHVAHLSNSLTYWGATLYFWARVLYVPAYAFGIPYVRSFVWAVSVVGLILLFAAIL